MRLYHFFLFIVMSIFIHENIYAQKIIQGTIYDKESNSKLANTNIQIKDTFSGTISNKEGKYVIRIKKFPSVIHFSYIGYKSEQIVITEKSSVKQNIYLIPVVIKLKKIVYRGENPAVSIMKEVIKRKKKWRKKLNTYTAKGYTRLVLENDTSIVCILESTSKVFWDSERGSRELINSKRETSNLSSASNFAGASYMPNFYDDDIQLQGADFIGPTHPKAIKYYDFRLENKRLIDNKTVFVISVTPKTKLTPAFIGKISILENKYAMIDINLKPGEAFILPPPVKDWNFSYEQQFSDFGRDFWFPIDVRINGSIKIGMVGFEIPRIKYEQISRMTDYKVNELLPDSLYDDKKPMMTDSQNMKEDTLLTAAIRIIPLTEREEVAYSELDSTMTLDKAFKPRGFFADMASILIISGDDTTDISGGRKGSKNFLSHFTPKFRFNRVDGFHLGMKFKQSVVKGLNCHLTGAYKTGLKRWSFKTGFNYKLARNLEFSIFFSDDSSPQINSKTYPFIMNSINTLFGYNDYYNYFWNRSCQTSFNYKIKKINSSITIGVKSEKHSNLRKNTNYNIFGRNVVQPDNLQISEGDLRSISFSFNAGGSYIPMGLIGQDHLFINIEYSTPDLFNSDFSFTSCYLTVDKYIETFYKRKVLPNSLNLRLAAFISQGDIPLQCVRAEDIHLGVFSPYGAFKALDKRPIGSDKYAGFFWEHNFRTIPFEIMGLRSLAISGLEIIVHGAVGKFWRTESKLISPIDQIQHSDRIHNEVGCSLNKIFGFFRLDLTRNLITGKNYIGVSAARMF